MFIPLTCRRSLVQFQSKRELLWRCIVAGNDKTTLDLHVKYPTFLPDFSQIGIFFDRFSQKPPVPNFTEILAVGAALIHAIRRTDMRKVLGVFRYFTNAPKVDRINLT